MCRVDGENTSLTVTVCVESDCLFILDRIGSIRSWQFLKARQKSLHLMQWQQELQITEQETIEVLLADKSSDKNRNF